MGNLLHAASAISGKNYHSIQPLTKVLLAEPYLQQDQFLSRPYSTLNNDGFPIQLCLTARRQGNHLRIIGDPASSCGEPLERLQQSQEALDTLLDLNHARDLTGLCTQTIQQNLPSDKADFAELKRSGMMWLAGGVDDRGIALYLSARWGALEDRWPRTLSWLQKLLPSDTEAKKYMASLAPYAVVASTGLEGTSQKDARLKIYWRLKKGIALDQLNIPLLCQTEVFQFLNIVLGDQAISRSGLVFSFGFSLATGALADAKIDVCAHCTPRALSAWQAVIKKCQEQFSFCANEVLEALEEHQCEIAFLGLGIKTNGSSRFNIYLKPNAQ